MKYNTINNQYLDLEIPVSYSIKKSLMEDMLTILPHTSNSNKYGNFIIKFSESDFIFSQSILDKFALMKHQVIPAIFFSNDLEMPNFIYVNSNEKNIDLNGNIISVETSKEFYPLYAITPGKNKMQINLDLTTLDIIYKFKVHIEEIENYSKVAIKFFYKNEIKSILSQFYSSK